jgi:hypothetical protein
MPSRETLWTRLPGRVVILEAGMAASQRMAIAGGDNGL